MKTHELTKHRLYKTWKNIIARCNNKNNPLYNYYGQRGIKVCDRWLNVANFIEDMYPTFKEGLSIDRENNDLGYEPSNCRWTNKTIQARNTKKIYSHNTSGYRGVIYSNKSLKSPYQAQIKVNGKNIYIGLYNTAENAAKARDKYVIDNNLEHTLNFPIQGIESKDNIYLVYKVLEIEKGLK